MPELFVRKKWQSRCWREKQFRFSRRRSPSGRGSALHPADQAGAAAGRITTEAGAGTAPVAAARTVAALGGAAPYWQSWTFDVTGNRRTQTQHGTAGDTTTASTYPAAGQPQPHTLTDATTTSPGGTTVSSSYTYDQAGNTRTRTTTGGGPSH